MHQKNVINYKKINIKYLYNYIYIFIYLFIFLFIYSFIHSFIHWNNSINKNPIADKFISKAIIWKQLNRLLLLLHSLEYQNKNKEFYKIYVIFGINYKIWCT